ncbi:biosynthetic-type acetolactate synthase large subunit [Neobacillus sp. LXY-4]|uniref:biosynthetic-type acetolactate synthase large subunit n=1 Tax=Neobacillus sp. LXY-4 TaxID=3379826 RepID=UPI003EE0409D
MNRLIDLKELTGADLLIESLASQGVKNVFGCQSDGLLPFHHVISGHSFFKYVQLKHEQAAVHAADGYARATGKPGVVLLSSAAGITNGVTGIATAHSDSVPIVVITGQYHFNKISGESPDDLNLVGVNVPITKHIFTVLSVNELQAVINQAFFVATEGRPGPVVIELSKEVLNSRSFSNLMAMPYPEPKPVKNFNEKTFEKAVEYIESARKPVFFIGGGTIISGAAQVLREIVEKAGIPVVSSLMGLGAMRVSDPLHLGMLGMHGTFASNKAVHRCDLLVSIGVRFSDRVTGKISGFSPKSKKVHVDIDPAEINKIIQVDLPIVSDAKEFLNYLNEKLDFGLVRENIKDWVSETSVMKRTVPLFDKSNSILRPQNVIKMLDEFSGEDTVVVTDVGQHQIWTANNYNFTKPRTLVTSGGLGTMGYGLPAAIGAAVGSPMKDVICVSGDGSFQMNLQEMITAVQYQLPIKIAIMNNGYLGMVRQWQEMFYERRYSSVKMTSPDFVKLAAAYGIKGFKASTEEEAREMIAKAFLEDGPVLMEFNVVEEENVYPIVPPNHSNDQLILSR